MTRIKKRFLIPLFLFLCIILFFIFAPVGSDYSNLMGAICTFFAVIILPAFLISLFWAIHGAVKDRKLQKAGAKTEDENLSAVEQLQKEVKESKAKEKSLSPRLQKLRSYLRPLGALCIVIGLYCITKATAGFVVAGVLFFLIGVYLLNRGIFRK